MTENCALPSGNRVSGPELALAPRARTLHSTRKGKQPSGVNVVCL